MKQSMSTKFIKKYMRLAKFIGEDQPVCFSRHIGAVITNAEGTRVLGCGYNGPPRGVPHCDTSEFLKNYFMPRLDECDFIAKCKGICPRRLIKANSGERMDLCPAQHAETNAIINAACDLTGAHLFCWCPVPCVNCSGAIIQAGIAAVHCLETIYDDRSLWLLEKGGVTLHQYTEDILCNI